MSRISYIKMIRTMRDIIEYLQEDFGNDDNLVMELQEIIDDLEIKLEEKKQSC